MKIEFTNLYNLIKQQMSNPELLGFLTSFSAFLEANGKPEMATWILKN